VVSTAAICEGFLNLSLGQRQMLASILAFTLMNIFAKMIPHLHFLQLVLVRAAIGLVLCSFFLHQREISMWPRNKTLLWLRGIFGTLSLCCFFYALQNLPLATTIVLQNLAPIFGLMLAGFISQESVAPRQWIFFLISFLGVIMVRGFDSAANNVALAAAVASAFFSALAHQMIRRTKKQEDPFLILFYFSVVSFFFVLPFGWSEWVSPSATDWFYLVGIGLSTFVGQVFLTRSLQNGLVQEVSQFGFLQVILAAGIGTVLFEESLGLTALLGIGVILLGVSLSAKKV
jgi:drug/metabolite transporter (DMT)-like permease